jgi:hypothetical protein
MIIQNTTKLILGICLLTAGNAWGATALVTGNIERVMSLTGTLYGGCMALLDVEPADAGLDCRSRWITFSCSGDFASRQDAQKNFELAQLAFVMEKPVRVAVRDNRTHNGFCYSYRIEVLP